MWRYLINVPIRYDEQDGFLVNYLSLEIRAEGAKKPGYYNRWITDKEITEVNVRYLAKCGQAR